MIALAIDHIPEITRLFRDHILEPRYQYFYTIPWVELGPQIWPDTANGVQFVSIEDQRVIGYLSCNFNRDTHTAYNVQVINFRFKNSKEFSRDMFRFFDIIYSRFGMNRVVVSVVVGNPVEKLYDKLAHKFHAGIIGTFHQDVMTPDGVLRDQKYYEVFKADFYETIKQTGAGPDSYRK